MSFRYSKFFSNHNGLIAIILFVFLTACLFWPDKEEDWLPHILGLSATCKVELFVPKVWKLVEGLWLSISESRLVVDIVWGSSATYGLDTSLGICSAALSIFVDTESTSSSSSAYIIFRMYNASYFSIWHIFNLQQSITSHHLHHFSLPSHYLLECQNLKTKFINKLFLWQIILFIK